MKIYLITDFFRKIKLINIHSSGISLFSTYSWLNYFFRVELKESNLETALSELVVYNFFGMYDKWSLSYLLYLCRLFCSKKLEKFTGWNEDLIWCPTQIRKIKKTPFGTYLLYLRWRWNDPFSFSIINEDRDEWSTDLFLENNIYCKDYEIGKAKYFAEKIWKNFLKKDIIK
jgi:hypothetical protein